MLVRQVFVVFRMLEKCCRIDDCERISCFGLAGILGMKKVREKMRKSLPLTPVTLLFVPKEARSGEIHCFYRTVSVRMKNV